MSRLRFILAAEIALALLAVFWCGLIWPIKMIIVLCILTCSRIPTKPQLSCQTVISSWGVFYQGIAYFPHQFKSPQGYHDFILNLRFPHTQKDKGDRPCAS